MNLDEVRVKINDINDQMLALFKERMELSIADGTGFAPSGVARTER